MIRSNVEAKMENTEKSKKSIRNLSIISAIMGFLGAIDSMAIGFYLLSTLFNPILIIDLEIQGYILTTIIGAITIILIYGSYLIFKNKNVKRGAEINLITGLILAFLYIYYAYLSQPSLLSWFTPGGILLIIPPILSGIIGKTASG
jgi:hypothetical protein